MPMDPQERAEAMKKFQTGSIPADSIIAKQFAKEIPQVVKVVRRQLERLDRIFQRLSPASASAKQTALFDAISAETDGSLILHDVAQLLDGCLAMANTHRQPGDAVLTLPFTDADVDAYEA